MTTGRYHPSGADYCGPGLEPDHSPSDPEHVNDDAVLMGLVPASLRPPAGVISDPEAAPRLAPVPRTRAEHRAAVAPSHAEQVPPDDDATAALFCILDRIHGEDEQAYAVNYFDTLLEGTGSLPVWRLHPELGRLCTSPTAGETAEQLEDRITTATAGPMPPYTVRRLPALGGSAD